MRNLKILFSFCLMVILTSSMIMAATITTTGSGNWSSVTPDAPWPGGTLPSSADDVIIADGHTVTINDASSYTVNSLTIGQGVSGILNYGASASAASSLTISGDLILADGAQYILGSLPSVQPNLYVNGNINVGNGAKFDHGSGSSKGVITNFTKSAAGDQTVTQTGTPLIIQFNKVVVNRPNIADRVVANCNVKLKGGNGVISLTKGTWEQTSGTLEQTSTSATNVNLGTVNGVLKISGDANFYCTSSIVNPSGSNGSDAVIIINTTGTFTVGGLSNQARLQNSNTLEIISGTVNIGGRFTIGAPATISGGNINIDPQGSYAALANTSNVFEVTSAGSLTMSAGTITVMDPISLTGSGLEVKFSTSATFNISGGTIRLGDGVSTTTGADGFQVSTHTVPLWNLEINGNNTIPGRAVTLTDNSVARHLVVQNNLTINSGTLFANYGTGSNITLGGAFTNSGTFTPASTATFKFNGSAAQITNILPPAVGNLNLDNSAGITITNPVTVSGMLTLGGNNSYTTLGNVSGYSGLTYSATVSQTTGVELPSSITNLTIDNMNGVTLGGNTSVNGTFTLTDGLVTLGSNNLTLGASATVSGTPSATAMVVATGSGELRKEFSADGLFVYPVGDNTGVAEYSPVELNFSGATYSPSAYAGVKLVDAQHPSFLGTPVDYLTRYWTVNQGGISSFTCAVKFHYVDADVVGSNESNIILWKYDGLWSNPSSPSTDITLNEMTGTVSSFSDFTGSDNGALPVELSTFNVSVTKNYAQLTWKTVTEVNSSIFDVQRKSENSEWIKIGEVAASGNSNSPKDYTFTDKNISAGKLMYRLKMIDADGSYQYSNTVEAEIEMPGEYAISQNYPNPFNPTTRIDYQLPFDSKVTLELYGITGEKVATIINSEFSAGYYSADVNASSFNLASGIYIYRIMASNPAGQNFVQVKKLMLTK